MDVAKISFDIAISDSQNPIEAEVHLDNNCIFPANKITEKTTIQHEINDVEGDHELKIIISGKTADHTTIDHSGNIIKDVTLQVSNVKIDDLDINQTFFEHCLYTHDFNGFRSQVVDPFYGTAGCNGTISFKFSTPMYLWLLENM